MCIVTSIVVFIGYMYSVSARGIIGRVINARYYYYYLWCAQLILNSIALVPSVTYCQQMPQKLFSRLSFTPRLLQLFSFWLSLIISLKHTRGSNERYLIRTRQNNVQISLNASSHLCFRSLIKQTDKGSEL